MGPNYVVSVRHASQSTYEAVRARCESPRNCSSQRAGLRALRASWISWWTNISRSSTRWKTHSRPGRRGVPARPSIGTPSSDIYDLKRNLLEMKRAVSPLVDVCNQLMRFDHSSLMPEDTRPYFRDVYDHAIRINEHVDTLRELLTAALEAHLSMATVGQNEAMKKLAAWAAILGGAHHGRGRVRDELRVHAGARVALRLPAGDGGHGGDLRFLYCDSSALAGSTAWWCLHGERASGRACPRGPRADRGTIELVTLAAYEQYSSMMPEHWEPTGRTSWPRSQKPSRRTSSWRSARDASSAPCRSTRRYYLDQPPG